jgi:addiction module HigA family antidote
MRMETLAPVHPGEILKEEFLVPLGITNNELAMSIRVPASRIDQIVKGKRSITADTALRLAQYFGNSAQFWMNLQSLYDLSLATASIEQIRREVVRRSA